MAADQKARARLDKLEDIFATLTIRTGVLEGRVRDLTERADDQDTALAVLEGRAAMLTERADDQDIALAALGQRVTYLEEQAFPDLQPDPDPAVLAYDPCTDPDPLPLWGSLDAEDRSRHERLSEFGTNFRRLHVHDGDDYYGERCELGRNALSDTFAVYREGDTLTTSFDLRLDPDYALDSSFWADVMQMKQIASESEGETSTGVAMELSPMGGRLALRTFWTERAWFPLTPGEWTPIKIEAHYSIDPVMGYADVWVGDESGTYTGPTLARAGDRSIPSHLRLGIYQHPVRKGTFVDVANIKVEEAS